MLHHVHQVQVLLPDVVHRPVGRGPQRNDPEGEPALLARVTAGVPAGTTFGPMTPRRVHVEADDAGDEQPHLRVRHPAPEVDRVGGLGAQEHVNPAGT